jgi:hypothetical protein
VHPPEWRPAVAAMLRPSANTTVAEFISLTARITCRTLLLSTFYLPPLAVMRRSAARQSRARCRAASGEADVLACPEPARMTLFSSIKINYESVRAGKSVGG